jgi:hypothetical protein
VKTIANIICPHDLDNHKPLEWINYVPSISDCNLKLPTLVIGWEKVKHQFQNLKPSILQKRLPSPHSSVTWEFSKEEKMTDHFNGIEKFIKTAPREFIDMFPYGNVDPIRENVQNEDHLLEILSRKIDLGKAVVYQYKEEMIYIFDRGNQKKPIWSVYLNSYKYFGYDTKKIIDLIETNIPNKISDPQGLIYQSYYKQFPEFDHLKRTMVLFLS